MKRIIAWGRTRLPLVAIAAVAGIAIGVGADRVALAQQPGITRTILLRADDPANPAYEAVVGVAELPPGASAGRHRHYGIEVGYVLEGSVILEREGKPAESLTAGQAFKNEGGGENPRDSGQKGATLSPVAFGQ